MCSTLPRMFNSISVLNARIVPLSVADAGMTLKASPALIAVTETIPDSNGERVRDTIDWRLDTKCDAATIGSMVLWGMAACPPFPWSATVNISAAPMSGPGFEATVPVGSAGHTCMPKASWAVRSFVVTTPSSTIRFIPAPPSSAGWNTNRTVPTISSSTFFNSAAAPSNMVVCPSCPQACILCGLCDLKVSMFGVASSMGRASMSARSMMHGSSGFIVPMCATTPYPPGPG
mmetsp:Transcript_37671/g.64247  ORF Transcript_37671/g.64247 Transcript_37671/m.64247 type:complete len:232 (+) Transcript_37671:704-1399(+)